MAQKQQAQSIETEGELTSSPAADEVTATAAPDTEAPSTETTVEDQTAPVVEKKRVKKKGRLVSVDEILPKPSYWPVFLAFAVAALLFGCVSNPYMLGVGIILVIVAVLGWTLERR
ncbi:aa3-type cytochrome oxidase subunit IV [Tengunoibacter tsumagoiensis]|uniref:cytochrome-c oxidase n=1 Tax=Tengunoibacter tsumagoiensis TaxID=2014871 RepID=A0A402A5L0_9CHLR|nr:cytochrome c oxidase subunit 4 [Tengunoibacter tsumagoiensis]GCE14390.1 hypothetical protein KTT_42490 [Tengunoibacter tsumagoiensis]